MQYLSNPIDNSPLLDQLKVIDLSDSFTFGFLPEASVNDDLNAQYLILPSSVIDIRKRLGEHANDESLLEMPNRKTVFRNQHSSDYVLPTIVFSLSYLTNNPHIISVILGILSNFATGAIKSILSLNKKKNVTKLSIVIVDEYNNKNCQFDYEGPSEGIKEIDLEKIVEKFKQ